LRWLMLVRCMVNFFGCACCRWLAMSLGHFLFGLQEDGTIPCLVASVLFTEHAIKQPVLHSTPATASVCVAASCLASIITRIMHPILTFCSQSESASRPLVDFGVLKDNLIKGLISSVKCISRFQMKSTKYSLIHLLKYNHEAKGTM
jgi:hypothetical protein